MGDSIKKYYDDEEEKILNERIKKLSEVVNSINLNEIDEIISCVKSLGMIAHFNKSEWEYYKKIEKFINKFNI
jgi:hypothetical protein